MPVCPTDSDLSVATNSGQVPGHLEADQTGRIIDPAVAMEEARERIRMDNAEQQAAVTAVKEAQGTVGPSLEESPAQAKAQAKTVARHWLDDIEDVADVGLENRTNAITDIYRESVGLTSGGKSWWLNLTTAMARRFTTAKADFHNWVLQLHVDPNTSTQNQGLIQDLNMVTLNTQGAMQRFESRLTDFSGQADTLARRIGVDSDTMRETLGRWLNYRAVPERNAHLLEKWRADLEAERAKPAEKQNADTIAELEDKITRLEENLDNENPNDPLDAMESDLDSEGVISCGWTDGEARAEMRKILDMGLTEEELNRATDVLIDCNRDALRMLAEEGLLDPAIVRTFPDWQFYAPFYSKFDNISGIANDTMPYNPGAYHEFRGRGPDSRPDNAYNTTLAYIRRASTAVGTKNFAQRLAITGLADKAAGRDTGIRITSKARIDHILRTGSLQQRRMAQNMMERGGYFVDLPVQQKDGSVSLVKKLVYFDNNWVDADRGLNGAMLNEAIMANPKLSDGADRVAKATSLMGQSFTRFKATFAPINAIKDIGERASHLSALEAYDQNGDVVKGSRLLLTYFANSARAARTWFDGINGLLQEGSKEKAQYDAYIRLGLRQQYTHGMDSRPTSLAESMVNRTGRSGFIQSVRSNPQYKVFNRWVDTLGADGQKVLNTIDAWNDYYNNIASFSMFKTLLDAGVSERSAAAHTAASMNLSQTGTWTPVMRMFWPFIKPTLQGGAAMLRSMGLSYDPRGVLRAGSKGWLYMGGMIAALSTLKPMIEEWVGRDPETGQLRTDFINLSDMQRGIPIGIGDGKYLKFPFPWGMSQIAATYVWGMDRVQKGLMTPTDFASELLFCVGKNAMPGNWPEFNLSDKPVEYLTQLFAPTLLTPFTEIATNTTRFGRPLTTARGGGDRALADQGKSSTPMVFHRGAKWITSRLGVEIAPEQLKALYDGFVLGPARVLDVAFGDAFDFRKGSAEKSAYDGMNPWVRAMGGTMMIGSAVNTGRAAFYAALDQYNRRIRKAGVQMHSSSYGSNTAKREAFQREQLMNSGEFTPEEIDDILALQSAQGQIGSLNSKFNQATRQTWLNADDSSMLREAFADLAQQEADIYNDIVNNLNFYR